MNYIDDSVVSTILHWDDKGYRFGRWGQIIRCIEDAFLDPTAEMVPKTYLQAGNGGDYRAMPAALGQYAALKWIGVFPENRNLGLPTTIGSLILNERITGKPLIAMDCSTLTAYRTAAVSAIAAKYCAKEAKEISFVGCGKQAYYHFLAYREVLPNLEKVRLYDRDEKALSGLKSKIWKEASFDNVETFSSLEESLKNADIITTLTPSTSPYLDIDHIKGSCHINAVGADAVGKRELHCGVIEKAADIICDDPIQAFHSGELQYVDSPYLEVLTLSNLIRNHKTMQLDKGISVFDSTGVAIEDIALAILVFQCVSD